LMRKDVTDTLNWLLRELSCAVVSYQYLSGGKNPLQQDIDIKLDPADLKKIRLTDGGPTNSRLIFSAADGKALSPKWPLALRGRECDAAREKYDRARDAAEKEIQEKGEFSIENQTKLMQAVNGLYAALDAAYPAETRTKNQTDCMTYLAGKGFVRTLVAAAHRAITINDSSVFSPDRFQGDSILGLIQHMNRHGLQFAPPEPGAEGIYYVLFTNLRAIYIEIGREQASDVQQRKAAEKDQSPKIPPQPKIDNAP
jgi:hypothetical protein